MVLESTAAARGLIAFVAACVCVYSKQQEMGQHNEWPQGNIEEDGDHF